MKKEQCRRTDEPGHLKTATSVSAVRGAAKAHVERGRRHEDRVAAVQDPRLGGPERQEDPVRAPGQGLNIFRPPAANLAKFRQLLEGWFSAVSEQNFTYKYVNTTK